MSFSATGYNSESGKAGADDHFEVLSPDKSVNGDILTKRENTT